MRSTGLRRASDKDGHDLFDYRIYAICGDGDLMEGVSNEAASIAGHLGLSNLIWFYDNNHITIEGSTSLAFSDDVATRFLAWHWNVQHVSDVNDLAELDRAIRTAQGENAAPHTDHREQPHRLGRSAQAGHGRGARRTAGGRGNQAHQGVLRMAAGCAVPGSRRSQGLHGQGAGAGRGVGAGVGREVQGLGAGISRSGEAVGADPEAGPAARDGTRTFRRFRPTPRAWHARVELESAERGSEERAVADWRRG